MPANAAVLRLSILQLEAIGGAGCALLYSHTRDLIVTMNMAAEPSHPENIST